MRVRRTRSQIVYWVPGPNCCSRVEIKEVLISRVSEHFVWVDKGKEKPTQEKKDSLWGSFHATWDEAYARIHGTVSRKLAQASTTMTALEIQKGQLEHMKYQRGRIHAANGQRLETDGVRSEER